MAQDERRARAVSMEARSLLSEQVGMPSQNRSSSAFVRPLTRNELRAGKASRHEYPSLPKNPIMFLLEDVQSGHNVGSVFRTADSLRAMRVALCGTTRTPPGLKITKASKGAENWVPWEYDSEALQVVMGLQRAGVMVVAAELTAHSIDYRKFKLERPCCLVLGNEKNGVSSGLLSLCDAVVHIPMQGMQNSLNVSVAAGILGYSLLGAIDNHG